MYTFVRGFAKLGAIHYKVCHRLTIAIVAEVVHEGIAEELGVTGSAGQVASRDDEVGITVVNLDRKAG